MKRRILIVDDEQLVLDALRRAMRHQQSAWEATYMDDPRAAWDCLLTGDFDAAVIDIRMPHLNGLELLERMRNHPHTRAIPVVVLTGLADSGLKRQALDLGAADLLNKPVETEELLARLRSVLRWKAAQDELRAHNRLLEEMVRDRTEDLFHSHLDIIWRLGKAAEHRDQETGNHVIRVGCISRAIAETLALEQHEMESLFLAAPLHDIGKIGIPDAILLKRGPLSPGEWAVMQQHCHIGARILSEDSHIRQAFFQWRGVPVGNDGDGDGGNPFLDMAAAIALSHHEKWDGSGYPQGLAGESIPHTARIVALADVFDALTSERPYQRASSEREALDIVRDAAGSHFDPQVYEAFMQSLPAVRRIRTRFADGASVAPTCKDMHDEKDIVCR